MKLSVILFETKTYYKDDHYKVNSQKFNIISTGANTNFKTNLENEHIKLPEKL